jgi:hypothetical protein
LSRHQHEDITSIDEVSKSLLSQVEEFFISYNRQRGKQLKVTATSGPKKGNQTVESRYSCAPGKAWVLGSGPVGGADHVWAETKLKWPGPQVAPSMHRATRLSGASPVSASHSGTRLR